MAKAIQIVKVQILYVNAGEKQEQIVEKKWPRWQPGLPASNTGCNDAALSIRRIRRAKT
jgi:hypothetical protein